MNLRNERLTSWERSGIEAEEFLVTMARALGVERPAGSLSIEDIRRPANPAPVPEGPSTGLAWSVEPGPGRYMEMSEDMRHEERNRWFRTDPAEVESMPSNATVEQIRNAQLRRRSASVSRMDTPPARSTTGVVPKAAPASLGPPPPMPISQREARRAPSAEMIPDPEQLVIITPTGRRFHSDQCVYTRNAEYVTLRVAAARRFRPCFQCGAQGFIMQRLVHPARPT